MAADPNVEPALDPGIQPEDETVVDPDLEPYDETIENPTTNPGTFIPSEELSGEGQTERRT